MDSVNNKVAAWAQRTVGVPQRAESGRGFRNHMPKTLFCLPATMGRLCSGHSPPEQCQRPGLLRQLVLDQVSRCQSGQVGAVGRAVKIEGRVLTGKQDRVRHRLCKPVKIGWRVAGS
ncbi:hypothetical protein JM93_02528 [Roseibium hamelinense]|uniref:Uncharacterized protein n=1 Tax=Roseibium hamelinense TaxID=150831 RepID=A0A562T104_9HYPH|nr:hypothetical protein JM93_02528 [Roseibium hamelinense]